MKLFNDCCVCFGLFFSGLALAADPAGKLAFVRGEVFVDGKVAHEGAPVAVGQVISTRLGKCAVLLSKEHVIHLDAESELKVTRALLNDETELDLNYGRTRMLIKNQAGKRRVFNVRTRSAVMGVRGTHILLESPRDADLPQKFLTVEGVAEVTMQTPAAPRVTLRQGETVDSARGDDKATPSVQKLRAKDVVALTDQIAPPPAPLRTERDVQRFPGRQGNFDPMRRPPPPGNVFPMFPQSGLRLDPVADALAGVGVKVTLRKFTPVQKGGVR